MDRKIFGKFTEILKKILILSEKIAKESAKELDTEDMLLSVVLTKGTLAFDMLNSFGISAEKISIISKLVTSQVDQKETPKISESGKKAIQTTLKIAADYSHALADVEHLLLALLSDQTYNSYKIVERTGVSPENISQQISTILMEISKINDSIKNQQDFFNLSEVENPTNDFDFERNINQTLTKNAQKEKTFIELHTINFTDKAKNNLFDPLIGRDDEIKRLMQILSRRTKNNPLLIGDPGVGKTAVIEGLAQKILSGKVPTTMYGKKILSLDINSIIAGTIYRGQFEAKMKKLLHEIEEDGKIILFIDEIHTTIGTGSAEGSLDIANILKPIMTNHQLQIIGATTYDEYKKHIEKDPAYERRFQTIKISEPTAEQTIKILNGLKSNYEKHHNVKYSEDAIVTAVELSERYITDRFLPDKAIDLIDEAAASTNVYDSANINLIKFQQEINDIQIKKEEAVNIENYESATQLRETEIKLKEKITKLKQTVKKKKIITITSQDISNTVAKLTGAKIDAVGENEIKNILSIEQNLKKNVKGQDEAISIISKSIIRNRAGISDQNKPIGSYLFLGPTGVGKTYLSKILAENLFGSADKLIKIDMSEFMEKHNVARLIGAPAGYIGYGEGGKLTEAVRRNPFSIVLFDEIEKAHPEVFNILLQILDDGYLTDASGKQVNFRNTIVILTSNLGTSQIKKFQNIGFSNSNNEKNKESQIKEKILEFVKKEIRPELINRLGAIVIFNQLSKKIIKSIVDLQLKNIFNNAKKIGLVVKFTSPTKKYLLEKCFNEEYGAREVSRQIIDLIENPLSEFILKLNNEKGKKTIIIDVLNDKVIIKNS